MKKKVIFGVLVVIAAGVGTALYMSQKGHAETADEEAAFSMTSDAIVQEFLDEEQAARTKYVDKVIEVSGPVFEINKADGQITGVKLSSDEFYIVNCTFQNPMDELTGENIKVKGVCSGFLGDSESMLPGGTVELKRSAIVKQ